MEPQKTIDIVLKRNNGTLSFMFSYNGSTINLCDYGVKQLFVCTKKDLEIIFKVRNRKPVDDDNYHILKKIDHCWRVADLTRLYGECTVWLPALISQKLDDEFPNAKKLYAWGLA